MSQDLEGIAATLVADGKGILAARRNRPHLDQAVRSRRMSAKPHINALGYYRDIPAVRIWNGPLVG